MTHNSGWIEVLPGGASEPLDSRRQGLKRFAGLQGGPGEYWVPRVEQWAKAKALEIHYIDNCWLRVAVSADQLVDFLEELAPQYGQWVAPLIVRVQRDDSYVIEAEEF